MYLYVSVCVFCAMDMFEVICLEAAYVLLAEKEKREREVSCWLWKVGRVGLVLGKTRGEKVDREMMARKEEGKTKHRAVSFPLFSTNACVYVCIL